MPTCSAIPGEKTGFDALPPWTNSALLSAKEIKLQNRMCFTEPDTLICLHSTNSQWYHSSVWCKNDTLSTANLQDSRKHSEAFTSILTYAPETRNPLEIFIMFLQRLAKVGPQPLFENARKRQCKSWALFLNALLGTFYLRSSLPLWDSFFIFKYVLQYIIVQGTVIYIYRLAVHLRKILTKQPTAFPSCIFQCGKRLPPCGLHPRHNCKPSHSIQNCWKFYF